MQFLQWATRQPNTWVVTFAQALAYFKSPPGTQVRGGEGAALVPDAGASYAGPLHVLPCSKACWCCADGVLRLLHHSLQIGDVLKGFTCDPAPGPLAGR